MWIVSQAWRGFSKRLGPSVAGEESGGVPAGKSEGSCYQVLLSLAIENGCSKLLLLFFFSRLIRFGAEVKQMICLPWPSSRKRVALDCELTLDVLTVAVNRMESGQELIAYPLTTSTFGEPLPVSHTTLCWDVSDQDVYLCHASKQYFPCCPRKSDHFPLYRRFFPEPRLNDLKSSWEY